MNVTINNQESSSSSTTTTTTPSVLLSMLEYVCCSKEDIFYPHLLMYLSRDDLIVLEQTSKTIQCSIQTNYMQGWKTLCQRDYPFFIQPSTTTTTTTTTSSSFTTQPTTTTIEDTPIGPKYDDQQESFNEIVTCVDWKHSYKLWTFWNDWTCNQSKAYHLIQAIDLWKRYKEALLKTVPIELYNKIIESLEPCISKEGFETQVLYQVPSSYVAFCSVHGGQRNRGNDIVFFTGIFGSYTCYDQYYSMQLQDMNIIRLLPIKTLRHRRNIQIGVSRGTPRTILILSMSEGKQRPQLSSSAAANIDNNNEDTSNDTGVMKEDYSSDEGTIIMCKEVFTVGTYIPQTDENDIVTVGNDGILSYFQQFIERIESGVYKSCSEWEEPVDRPIMLFPDANIESEESLMSVCVTHGIEVKASARWFPHGPQSEHLGLNFGYSIRIRRLVESSTTEEDTISETCQLVGRHWEFFDGNGNINRVNGEGVVGKQPLFFVDTETQQSGYIDLGPAGNGNRFLNETFVYQSQTGPVAGTTRQNTGQARVQGTFSFVPGSIDHPTGPIFHVQVAPFPLKILFPFY